ncbi:hypothetical protein O7605_29785 [Verrucosispora sp. WMMA2121]|uniref:RHS repeat-associated core domain-containing protein n=1 Tax=Verrucosispora sp. WMMA2121 TaxID=3015164 RepID=UPI0022B72DCE|nr:RHS repeat-associated core domain-containing protein [Verrucosispora sp. WMMA2121]MCZ7423706.1 hypothetical protein [Verrucosispora sp. WMMA2121]
MELLSRAAAEAAGMRGGLLLRVGRVDAVAAPGQVEVTLDYAGFAAAFGGDWASRLRLVQVPDCAVTSPGTAGCTGMPLPSRNDVRSQKVTAVVAAAPMRDAVSTADARRLGLTGTAASTGTLLALEAGPSGGAGDYSASSLAPASTWGHSGSTGGFQWSYPMEAPPAVGGPAPALALAYSSQAVDGLNAASNNQPGPIGEGFDYSPGFVERRYKACSDDMGGNANNTTKTGDLCWGSENAVLSLAGTTVELLKSADGKWHPRKEDGSKVELLTTPAYSNGDNDNEYWKVTTADGTRYWFGRHQLPGWSSGRPTTNSVLTAPVFGNNPGEPCHQTTFAASDCGGKRQAWRWNLDYVEDVHGNTMSLWWTKETNYYARNQAAAAPVIYDRAAYLTRIDYGTDNRDDTEYAATSPYVQTAPARVEFAYSDRCLSNCTTKNATTWPDTPWDQECTASTNPCRNASPTFWSAKRLTTVTTKVRKGSAYQNASSWTLRHTFPDPGDGTRAGLWLAGITRRGLNGTTVTLPEVTFAGTQMPNRVDSSGSDWALAMNWWRVNSIRTETGGEIYVTYSPQQCATSGPKPTDLDHNTLRCFPVKWIPQSYTSPVTDYFHKYVVTEVQHIDHTGGARPLRTSYEYLNPDNLPLWRYSDDNGLIPASRKSWGEWRGYPRVITYVGEGATRTKTETLYFRGMHGDKLAAGGTRSVTVQGLEGGAATDHDAFAGMPREQISWNGTSIVSASVSDPWRSAATATRSGTPTADARFVAVGTVRTRTAIDGGGWRRTRTVTSYDDYGMPVSLEDQGDEAIDTDTRCSLTEYIRNTTGDSWLLNSVKRAHGWAGPCATPPTSASQVIGDTRYRYDGKAYGVAPTRGVITAVDEITDWNGGSRLYQQVATMTHDAHGRPKQSTDITGGVTRTDYTPTEGGPLTKIVTTNPLLWTDTKELDPATGATVKTTDTNSRVTEVAHDALGRTAALWHPDRARATFPDTPSKRYTYTVATNTVSSAKVEEIDARGGYRTAYTLYDALGRDRQTQQAAWGGGRVLTDTFYDAAGRAWKENNAYYHNGTAGTTLYLGNDLDIPNQTRTLFDTAGRLAHAIQFSKGIEKWRTSTTYHGDHVATTPPDGGIPTSTWTDALGRTTELRQYHGKTPTGGYDKTTYTYDPTGPLKSVSDASGNTWSYQYDIRGRQTFADDPDRGETTTAYNTFDQVATVTDERGVALHSTYDELGRLTATRKDSATGPLVASWVYDLPAKGVLRSSSRWTDGHEYRTENLTVDARYRPTQIRYTIPPVEGGLAGTYSLRQTYNPDGSANTVTLPAAGGLAQEVLTYAYDSNQAFPSQLKTDYGDATHYVIEASYSNLNQPNLITRSTALTGAPFVQSGQYYEEATGRISRRPVIRSVAPSYIANSIFSYDEAGNIEKIDDNPGSGRDSQCFTYDHLRRLTQAWTPASHDCDAVPTVAGLGGPAKYWHSWDFGTPTDPRGRVGNRLSQTEHGTATGDVTTTYTYPDAGNKQPHSVATATRTDDTGTITTSYAYDEAGNTTTRPGPNGQQTVTWTPDGYLETITDSAGTSSYVTDVAGGRLITRDPTNSTLHLGPMELRLTKTTGAVHATRYYHFGDEVVAQRTTSGITWLADDHQGTGQVAVTGDAAQTVTRRRQTPYGNERGTQATWPNPRGFVGGYKDSTGLTQVGERMYDPLLGRFLSVDPVLDQFDPQQMNAYIYANNSPISFSDPTGLRWLEGNVAKSSAKAERDAATRKQSTAKANQKSDPRTHGNTAAHATAVLLRVRNLKKNFPHAVISSDAFGITKGADIICWNCKKGEVWVWEVKPERQKAVAPGALEEHISKVVFDPRVKNRRVIAGPNRVFNPQRETSPQLGDTRGRTTVYNGEKDGVQLYEQWRDSKRAPAEASANLREAEDIASDQNEQADRWKEALTRDAVERSSFASDVILFTGVFIGGYLIIRLGVAGAAAIAGSRTATQMSRPQPQPLPRPQPPRRGDFGLAG